MPKTQYRRDYESQTWNDNQAVQSHHVPKLTPVGTNVCLGYDGDLEAQILLHVSLQGMGLLREMQKCWGGGLSRTLYPPKCHFCTCDMLVFPTMASDLLWAPTASLTAASPCRYVHANEHFDTEVSRMLKVALSDYHCQTHCSMSSVEETCTQFRSHNPIKSDNFRISRSWYIIPLPSPTTHVNSTNRMA